MTKADIQSSYYIPKHIVKKTIENKTQYCTVFNAIGINDSETSLNDNLMMGLTLQPGLNDIIIYFHQYNGWHSTLISKKCVVSGSDCTS